MVTNPKFLMIAALAGFLTSCNSTYYVPSPVNSPLLQEKKELRVQGSFGSSDKTIQTNVQAAFAATENIGVMVNYMEAVGADDQLFATTVLAGAGAGRQLEAGGGYFTKLKNPNFIVEGYAGYGQAYVEKNLTVKDENYRYHRYFIQPGIGYRGDIIELSFALKSSLINYYDINRTVLISDNNELIDARNDGFLFDLKSNNHHVMIEPAINFRIGFKFIKLNMQLTHSSNLSYPDFPQDHINFNIGLTISLNSDLINQF